MPVTGIAQKTRSVFGCDGVITTTLLSPCPLKSDGAHVARGRAWPKHRLARIDEAWLRPIVRTHGLRTGLKSKTRCPRGLSRSILIRDPAKVGEALFARLRIGDAGEDLQRLDVFGEDPCAIAVEEAGLHERLGRNAQRDGDLLEYPRRGRAIKRRGRRR